MSLRRQRGYSVAYVLIWLGYGWDGCRRFTRFRWRRWC